MRTHTEWGSKDQEPWSYGPEYEEINKRTIELRYRLLPYVYNEMYKASMTGIPPIATACVRIHGGSSLLDKLNRIHVW